MGDLSLTEPVGKCSLATLSALQEYGLRNSDIIDLCQGGCQGFQDCLNVYLLSQTASANTKASDVSSSLDVAFMLYNGYMVFMMQLGNICI